MKKALTIFLSIVIVICTATVVFTACSKGDNNQGNGNETPQNNENVESGGWGYNTEFDAPKDVAEDAKKAFEDGASKDFEMVAFLGTLTTDVTNYAYLCTADSKLAVLTIMVDSDGKASMTNAREVKPDEYRGDEDLDFSSLSGGWDYTNASGVALEADVQAAFDDANQLTGVSYEPLALIGTQVVGGFNYEILCKATPSVDAPCGLVVVTVFASADGENEIISQCGFSIAE